MGFSSKGMKKLAPPPPPVRESAQDVARAEDKAQRDIRTSPGLQSTQLGSLTDEEMTTRKRNLFGQS